MRHARDVRPRQRGCRPEPTRLDVSQDSHLESLYRAAIGPRQASYYLPILTRFEAYGRAGPRWNWAACLVTLNWMVLRGLWLPALAYLAAMATAVLALAAGLALAEPPAPDSVQWGLWAALLTLALLVPGFFGNAWLYRVYRQRLDNALARTANLKDACTLLARQSRSRPRLTAIALANAALIVSVAIMLWPLHLQQRVWPRVSGEVAIVAGPAAHARPPTAAPTADTAAPTVAAPDPSASAADLQQPADVVQAPPSAAQEPVLETPSTAAVPPAAPAIAEPRAPRATGASGGATTGHDRSACAPGPPACRSRRRTGAARGSSASDGSISRDSDSDSDSACAGRALPDQRRPVCRAGQRGARPHPAHRRRAACDQRIAAETTTANVPACASARSRSARRPTRLPPRVRALQLDAVVVRP